MPRSATIERRGFSALLFYSARPSSDVEALRPTAGTSLDVAEKTLRLPPGFAAETGAVAFLVEQNSD
jgi:hypothetical protein